MPDPQAPSGTREKTPSHREIHDYHRARHTGAHPATGVLYISNALAFNTLLSSQETDAHLRRTLVPPPGQPLNFTPSRPTCQAWSSFELLLTFWDFPYRQHANAREPPRLARQAPDEGFLVAPQVPSRRLAAFRPLGARRTLEAPESLVKSRRTIWIP